MFHFRTNHNQERRDGFVSFRCFLWLGGRGGERNWRGGKRTERMGTGIGGGTGTGLGEDGNWNRRGWKEDEEDGRGLGEEEKRTFRKKKRDF